KDIRKAHDDLVSVIGKLERELEEKEYEKRQKSLQKYEQEIDEFMFLVPKDLQEIVNEGNALHHCVGGKHYLDNHTKGNTNIIFIRQKEKVEKPYFTLEYKNQHVAQVQGKYNRETVPNDLQKAINKWEDKIKRIS
ncbi:PcfJ protein, partial [Listeria monocytogenes]|nr:PcfJ protein [Listeria monocytogenes]